MVSIQQLNNLPWYVVMASLCVPLITLIVNLSYQLIVRFLDNRKQRTDDWNNEVVQTLLEYCTYLGSACYSSDRDGFQLYNRYYTRSLAFISNDETKSKMETVNDYIQSYFHFPTEENRLKLKETADIELIELISSVKLEIDKTRTRKGLRNRKHSKLP